MTGLTIEQETTLTEIASEEACTPVLSAQCPMFRRPNGTYFLLIPNGRRIPITWRVGDEMVARKRIDVECPRRSEAVAR